MVALVGRNETKNSKRIMTKKEYNGWFNYETWLVKLWIDNDQGSQSYWQEQAEEFYKVDADDCSGLADALKEHHEEYLSSIMPDSGFAADLMSAAMSEVNWREIAESLINDAKEAVEA